MVRLRSVGPETAADVVQMLIPGAQPLNYDSLES